VVLEPEIDADLFGDNDPVIYATWHGQNFIFAFRFKNRHFPALLVAQHGDGLMIGNAQRLLGVPLIYGSGTTDKRRKKKGGAVAFLKLLRCLKSGTSITLTADLPKIAREVGEGIVLLARKSGVPIVPVGMASSNRRIANSWDRVLINLPFSRIAYVRGELLSVPDDDTPLADYQSRLHAALEVVNQRALLLADGKKPESPG